MYHGRYTVESKKDVLVRCVKHQKDSTKGNWESYGATKHTKEWNGQFNGIHHRKITVMLNMHTIKEHEALEINKIKTLNETDKTLTILNRNNAGYVATRILKLLFRKKVNQKTVILTLNSASVWKRFSQSSAEISLIVINSFYLVHYRLL